MSQVRVGVGVFMWKDGLFLMGKRRGSHGHNSWSIPGGHLEFNETIEQCAVREAKEETNLDVRNVSLVAVTEDMFREDQKHYVTIWVRCDVVGGDLKITEPNKWIGSEWRDFKSLPSPLFEPCWSNLRKIKPELFS